jgi:hypothetical protein|tara:strand:+ start:8612 stop:9382 length:771 start_codon:yes stop_codon:yes gene_type:complete
MGTKIYHPISPEVQDQTGLALCGRHQDGRYQYRSVSLFHHRNVMSLTHNERVGLALCYALAKKMRPGTATAIYPMTKTNSASGWGSYGSARLWLMKPHLAELGRHYIDGDGPEALRWKTGYRTGLSVLAHEMGHNTQRLEHGGPGKPHGPQFDAAHIKMRLALKDALRKGWPKLDMRKLRDRVAPHLAAKASKQKRKEVAASETRVTKWTRKLTNAEANLERWTAQKEKADRMIKKHEKAMRHAQVFLTKAIQQEI